MNHCGTKTIETERLILRQIRLSDAEVAFENWMSDDKVTEFLTWPTHKDVSESEEIIREWIGQYEDPDFYQWVIVLKEIDEPIGSISVVEKDESINMFHVGYCMGRRWWHKGIMTEALKAVIKYLFTETDVNRIEARHDPNNPHSGDVMKKCGLRYEGTMRQADRSNKGIVDAAFYSILRLEWEEQNP
ncbi:MAG: GNAT family N-acetyltransferase [Bacillota bacterium]